MNKRIHWTTFVVLSLFSPALLALGLGGAVVESYLDQPLVVRVELISQSDAELQSITAGLASADDFQLLGMSRSAISVPLKFELVTDTDRPYVRITSDLKVSEPVVQVLMEVVWASGRMLREYTLFLDPPTIESSAPPVTIRPAPAAVKALPVESKPTPVTAIQKPVKAKVQKEEKPAVTEEPTDSRPAQSADAESTSGQTTEQYSEDEIYGPVASGQTLWGIAREYSKGSGYSINQAMIALQRKNPDAFIKGNINLLKRGAILRLPAFRELGELTSREAMLEAQRQAEEIKSGVRSVAPEVSTPTVADSGDYQASVIEEVPDPGLKVDDGHLELVPPVEKESQDSIASEQVPVQDAVVESLQNDLSRTEEELVNARQENTYLTDRIKELEDQARAREEQMGAVKDSELANMESRLEQKRAAGQAEPPIAITPGGAKQAWYAGKTPLIGGFALILIALIVWVLRNRSTGLLDTQRATEVQAIADDAQDILRALDSDLDEGETIVQARSEPKPEPELKSEPELESELSSEPEELPPGQDLEENEGPTVVLLKPAFGPAPDIESEPDLDTDFDGEDEEEEEDQGQQDDDPEIKLDLARAYLSLGDKEASKSMLDDVMKSGNEAQKAEARQMLSEL